MTKGLPLSFYAKIRQNNENLAYVVPRPLLESYCHCLGTKRNKDTFKIDDPYQRTIIDTRTYFRHSGPPRLSHKKLWHRGPANAYSLCGQSSLPECPPARLSAL
jgi:hypothetical protein